MTPNLARDTALAAVALIAARWADGVTDSLNMNRFTLIDTNGSMLSGLIGPNSLPIVKHESYFNDWFRVEHGELYLAPFVVVGTAGVFETATYAPETPWEWSESVEAPLLVVCQVVDGPGRLVVQRIKPKPAYIGAVAAPGRVNAPGLALV